jgi:hypothetical protein
MTYLALVLAFKIVVTALMVSLPLLLLPGRHLQMRFKVGEDALPLARLYGIAVTALLVGYAAGFAPAQAGVFPWGVVVMGIVSNLGATVGLVVTGGWRTSIAAPFVFGGIALALIAAACLPGLALTRVL